MDKIGLSIEELDKILLQYINPDAVVSAHNIRLAIATAIEENNRKLQEDIAKLIQK
ncbi:hypothetical protein [Brevibacillus laterosporus]|uniref:hypothetical protein n=1 Tax=Brevibacillus laterosporus TaxID=1465 RepID=UPI002407021D|nr:hypothetical protein [Brevibacillus laterosporus]